MSVSIEEKKAEAIDRMKKIGIFGPTIKQFRESGLVSISEPPFGAFYWAEGEDLKRIKEFEEQHNALVYVVIRSYTEFGQLDAFLYVSDYKDEEWEMDREDLKENQQCAWVYNHDAPWCSEFGSIGFEKTAAAGLRRTW